MITSAWGPAAMAPATSTVTGPPMATMPPKADCGIAGQGPLVGHDQVRVEGGAARVGVLDDGHGPVDSVGGGQLVDQAPGRVGVEDVEVGELLAAVLDDVVPPRVQAGDPVAGPVLVGILPVAQGAGPLEGQVDGGREDGRLAPRLLLGPHASNQSTMAAS